MHFSGAWPDAAGNPEAAIRSIHHLRKYRRQGVHPMTSTQRSTELTLLAKRRGLYTLRRTRSEPTRPSMPRPRTPLKLVQPAPVGATERIVASITEAIVERRLMPGTKLAEQKIADIFKVSRTLVRQALNS
jgi:Bacterial regulatory proteins, gntR family